MRAFLLGLLTAALLSLQAADAADIEYVVGFRGAPEFATPEVAKPFSIEVKDRVWATTGIEESVGRDSADIETRVSAPVKEDVDPSEVFGVDYGYWRKMQVTVAHSWIETSLWPLTREAFSNAAEWEQAYKAMCDDEYGYVF